MQATRAKGREPHEGRVYAEARVEHGLLLALRVLIRRAGGSITISGAELYREDLLPGVLIESGRMPDGTPGVVLWLGEGV